jgi:cytochrome c oxidase assembly protein subunit 15
LTGISRQESLHHHKEKNMIPPQAPAANPTVTRTARRVFSANFLNSQCSLRRCTVAALLLAAAVVAMGAYVRLNDAGLSCPDWPGCYGRLSVSAATPDAGRARIEMTHRYLAGSLGLLIAAIFLMCRRQRRALAVPGLLLTAVIIQALLGRWTVTDLLKPAVVTAHLLGGFTILALLGWQSLCLYGRPDRTAPTALRLLAALVLCAAAAQVALGGWTSANHAALACGGFPLCHGRWQPPMDFAAAFTLSRPAPGPDAHPAVLATIHWSHRLGALALALLVIALGMSLWRRQRTAAATLLALLAVQLGLGITIVLLQRPLAAAVMHSFCAALLVLCLTFINFDLRGRAGR